MVVKFKKYLLVALACFFIVILTFTLGTFNPNFIKIKELEQIQVDQFRNKGEM